MKKCKICGGEIKSSMKTARVCGSRECNKVRCQQYYRDHLKTQKKKKLDYYYFLKENKYEYLREVNRRAKHRQRFGVASKDVILERDGFKCRSCGSKKRLMIHHLDHKGRGTTNPNNSLENLVTVCASCHASHHFGHSKLKI